MKLGRKDLQLRKTLATSLVILFLLSTLLSIGVPTARATQRTIVVPDDYPTIQAAIDNASNGDTVFVKTGVYNEAIVVNKTLSLLGQDPNTTIISEEGAYSGVLVTSDNVTIEGFSLQDYGWSAIRITSSNCLVSNNFVFGSRDSEDSIWLDGRQAQVEGNIVANNVILNSGDCGILAFGASENNISNNTVKNAYFGIALHANSNLNQVTENDVDGSQYVGVYLTQDCSNNTISCNTVTRNGGKGSFSIVKCGIGIFEDCDSNQILLNNVSDNAVGLCQNANSGNVIYHNSFINNSVQVSELTVPCHNIWDNGYPSGGNYWSDDTTVDVESGPYQNVTGSDGIRDAPYIINSNNIDHYPLVKSYVFLNCDINRDGKVDMRDLGIVAETFGSFPGNPRWNSAADINQDGKVDLKDIGLVARQFGKYS